MTENQDQINKLLNKLEELLKRQEDFSKEVNELREELNRLKSAQAKKTLEKEEPIKEKFVDERPSYKEQPSYSSSDTPKKLTRDHKNKILGGVCAGLAEYYNINLLLVRLIWLVLSFIFCIGFIIYALLWVILPSNESEQVLQHTPKPVKATEQVLDKTPEPVNATPTFEKRRTYESDEKGSNNLERFIGENLISKIGIVIVVIGVGIGVKYTIEHDLISPLVRIILGYLVGLGLLGFGIKLKQNYTNFSAVLVSGAMAILYFITYIAYGFYDLISQLFAFGLMVIFTVFTVFSALSYNKQIIAHYGLVGAYAIPFLLGDNSGNATILFSYMAIINIGILFIAFKKYWKLLYMSSFVLTWLIFSTWYMSSYQEDIHFIMALSFVFLFFAIFYTTFLAFKLIQKEKFDITDILLLLINSFIFYGFGYDILEYHHIGTKLLGLFTFGNGLLHALVSVIIYKQKLGDKNLFYLVSGLVLVFITITIPVQLDGNWVTLLWVGEAVLLFWIGRTKNTAVYEYISYPLMSLAVLSIVQDWTFDYNFYNNTTSIIPIFNIHFLTSVLFIGGFSYIYILDRNEKYKSLVTNQLLEITSFLIPTVLIGSIYIALRLELENYWQTLYDVSSTQMYDQLNDYNSDLLKFKNIWVLNYTLLFVTVLSFLNIKRIKNRVLGQINLALNVFVILIFLIRGLFILSDLRESYLDQTLFAYDFSGAFHIVIRYISFIFLGLILFACYKYIKQEFMKMELKMAFDILLYTSILWIASSELIHWLDMAHSTDSYKLGLSILWGVYSLILISFGIWKTKKHLRIGAITLFSVTLIKLFFYDLIHLNNISKTIVFISLGILLLIISFLYNKYKHKITN